MLVVGHCHQTRHRASTSTRRHFTFRRCVVIAAKAIAPIANAPNTVQLGGTPYHSPKLCPGPCSSVGMRWGTDSTPPILRPISIAAKWSSISGTAELLFYRPDALPYTQQMVSKHRANVFFLDDKMGKYQDCSVLCCVRQLCTVIRATLLTYLTVSTNVRCY